MELALRAENSTCVPHTALVEELDHTISRIASPGMIANEMTSSWYDTFHVTSDQCSTGRCYKTFLAYAVSKGLTRFAKSKIEQSKKVVHLETQLLVYATWHQLRFGEISVAHPEMVAMLLRIGYDPNRRTYPKGSPWSSLIAFIGQKVEGDRKEVGKPLWSFDLSWVSVCNLFVLSGADVKSFHMIENRRCTAWEVFEPAFAHLPQGPVLELQRLLEERGAPSHSALSESQDRQNWQQNSRNSRDRRQRSQYASARHGQGWSNLDQKYLLDEAEPRYRQRRSNLDRELLLNDENPWHRPRPRSDRGKPYDYDRESRRPKQSERNSWVPFEPDRTLGSVRRWAPY